MNIAGIFAPRAALSEQERASGLRAVTWQAISASGADGVASGGFLAAFALALGASNLQIGILTALPFIIQPLQILAVALVERWRRRKAIAVAAYFVAYSVWIPIAAIPVLVGIPSPVAVSFLLTLVAVRGAANAFVNCSWNSWLRDIVPQDMLGKFFAQRMRYATLTAAVAGLGAALYIDYWKSSVSEDREILGYSFAMLVGSIFLGWAAVGFMSRIPEPLMQAAQGASSSLRRSLAAPFSDRNFRQLINFLFLWHLVSHLAIPFFTVFMLVRLELPLSLVVAFGVLTQLTNVAFLRLWGPLVDRFGSKVVLSVSTSLYLLVMLGWAFTTMPDPYFLTTPLLVVLHLFAGVAAAGVSLANTTIRMKLAPQAQATAYLTGASLAANLGAGIGPLLGGLLVDFFTLRELEIRFSWIDPTHSIQFPAIYLTGFDFLFVLSFFLGLIVLNTLTTIQEEGGADRQAVLNELMAQTRDNLRVATSVPGLGFISHFPYGYLRYVPQVPGLDVAVGITAYQIASSTRSAIAAANWGGAAARDIADRVGGAVHRAASHVSQMGTVGERQAVDIARNATRGALHAVDEVAVDVRQLARGSVLGTVRTLGKIVRDPRAVLQGVGYGAIQGAGEAGVSVSEVVAQAVEGARETARELGMAEDEAAAQVAQGVLQAAETMGPEAVARAREALAQQGLVASPPDPRTPEGPGR